jgi:hypothetical protein
MATRLLGREPAVRARAGHGLPFRRGRCSAGDRRDADHDADRHARTRRSLPAAERIRARRALRARLAGRRPRGRTRGRGRSRPLAPPRRVRRLGGHEHAPFLARPLSHGRLRRAVIPLAARDPRPRRQRARASGRGGRRRARAPALARTPRTTSGPGATRSRSGNSRSAARRTSTRPSCSSAR